MNEEVERFRAEIGEVDRQGGPMETPIGYGSTHRSIFPESQFRKDGGSVFTLNLRAEPNGS